jgi:hypothetical protein
MVSTAGRKYATATVPKQQRHDGSRHARGEPRDAEDDDERGDADRGVDQGELRQRVRDLDQARKEHAGRMCDRQAEEVLDLGAGDQHGDAVREPDHDGTRDEPHGGPHAGDSEQQDHHAGHGGDHVEPVDAVRCDDPGDHDDERAGRAADLRA